MALLAAARDCRSLNSVSPTMAPAPHSAVKPITGWNRNKHDQEQRHPRHVEKRRRSDAGQERADLVEIAQRLLRQERAGALQRQGGEREMDRLLQAGIEQRADARQHAAAQRVEIALQQVGEEAR